MTHRLDVARRRDLAARWCALAERRLQHLTELFESGRWRRYYSERAFLENIREAKAAVETWRALSGRSTARHVVAVAGEDCSLQPLPPAAKLPDEIPLAETSFVSADEAPSAPIVDIVALERVLLNERLTPRVDLATVEKRYPLLHNSF